MKLETEQLGEKELTENTMEIDLRLLEKAEQKATADPRSSIKEQVESELDDTSWLYENTVTNMPAFESTITNLKLELEADSGEPAWRALEKRREAAELKNQIGDDFFDLVPEDPVQ